MTLQVEIAVLAAFFALLVGYAIGRRHGKEEGFTEGIHYGPLEMRRFTLERGRCVICGSPAGKHLELGAAQPPSPAPSAEDMSMPDGEGSTGTAE